MATEEKVSIPCTEDGKVTKVILKEGAGDAMPTDDQEVDVTYIGTLEDGTEFDRGTDLENPFQFFIGTEEIIKGWSHGVKTMKKGETAKITIGSEYAYGPEGRAPKIGPNATLCFEITLIDFRDRTKSKYDYEPEERLAAGISFKAEGNEKFKAGDLEAAVALYNQAVEFLEEQKEAEATTNLVAVYLNLSLISFKASEFSKAADFAEKAMQREPNTLKAYYRRGQANLSLKNWEAAILDLEFGMNMDASNVEIKRLLVLAKKGLATENKKQQVMYGKMFGSGEIYETPALPKDDYTDPSNPRVFFDVKIGEKAPERIEFELYANAAPRCAENFRALCTGEKGKSPNGEYDLHYKGHIFHRNIDGFMIQGGDIEFENGRGGASIYGNKFDDEPFLAKHTARGILSMANAGPNTNGSQFFLCYGVTPHLDGKHVVFGKAITNLGLLDRLEQAPGGDDDKPKEDIRIVDCGMVEAKVEA